jgi:hypothetical protein
MKTHATALYVWTHGKKGEDDAGEQSRTSTPQQVSYLVDSKGGQ